MAYLIIFNVEGHNHGAKSPIVPGDVDSDKTVQVRWIHIQRLQAWRDSEQTMGVVIVPDGQNKKVTT